MVTHFWTHAVVRKNLLNETTSQKLSPTSVAMAIDSMLQIFQDFWNLSSHDSLPKKKWKLWHVALDRIQYMRLFDAKRVIPTVQSRHCRLRSASIWSTCAGLGVTTSDNQPVHYKPSPALLFVFRAFNLVYGAQGSSTQYSSKSCSLEPLRVPLPTCLERLKFIADSIEDTI